MKSVFPIVLLFCLALPLCTTVLWFKHEQKSIKKEVKHQIIAGVKKTDLHLIKLTASDSAKLYWKHAKEFKFEGYMYDIVERKHQNDTTYYWCWKDYAETALEKELKEKVSQLFTQHPDKDTKNNQLQRFFKSLCIGQTIETKLQQFSFLPKTFFHYQYPHSSSVKNIPTPPPQV